MEFVNRRSVSGSRWLRQLLGTSEDQFVFIPDSSLPFPPTSNRQPLDIVYTTKAIAHGAGEKRFNDAAVDPAGRFLAGTMGREHHLRVGKMYSLEDDGGIREIMNELSCSNGMGWSEDGTIMWVVPISFFGSADV
jgi:hypothetical protein